MEQKTYYLSLENMVPNAFIELNKRKIKIKKIPLITIEKYGDEVAKKLQQNGNQVIFGLSRDNTQNFSINYSKYFTLNDLPEDKPSTITLNDGITTEDLINHFTGCEPLEVLIAFQNTEVVQLGLLNNLNLEKQITSSQSKRKVLTQKPKNH